MLRTPQSALLGHVVPRVRIQVLDGVVRIVHVPLDVRCFVGVGLELLFLVLDELPHIELVQVGGYALEILVGYGVLLGLVDGRVERRLVCLGSPLLDVCLDGVGSANVVSRDLTSANTIDCRVSRVFVQGASSLGLPRAWVRFRVLQRLTYSNLCSPDRLTRSLSVEAAPAPRSISL